MTFKLYTLTVMSDTIMSMEVQIILDRPIFITYGYVLRSGITPAQGEVPGPDTITEAVERS
jgi:hypothetical protein